MQEGGAYQMEKLKVYVILKSPEVLLLKEKMVIKVICQLADINDSVKKTITKGGVCVKRLKKNINLFLVTLLAGMKQQIYIIMEYGII